MELRAYILLIACDDEDYSLEFAAPKGVCGESGDELWLACSRLHDRTHDWHLCSAEVAGAPAGIDFVLTVPREAFEHAIGCAALAVAECRRKRVLAAVLGPS